MDNVRPEPSYSPHIKRFTSQKQLLTQSNPENFLQDHAVVDSGLALAIYDLKFTLFSVLQMSDKKNSVLFTDTECLILSPSFKLLDESQVVLRAPRQNGVYNLDLKNIVPSGGITCLYANATSDESKLWHKEIRSLGKFDGKSDEGYLLGYSTTSTQEYYVAGSSEKDMEPTQEYILLPLHPHRPRISVEDVVQAIQEKPFENSPKDNDVHDSEDVAEKEEQHTLTKAEQVLIDDLERIIAQEIVAKAIDDATRQAFKEEKKRAAQATLQLLTNINTEDDSNIFPNDGIFSGAYNNEDVGAEADFNNMDNTIDVSSILTLRVHKDHPKGQILGDPKSAVQTRGSERSKRLL
ncbi:hypothetical protein Tco_0841251 [Tanacetum coccineum]|uniref:PH domain-containing protein n=1 Tax=Tanacetum coccineum TaxID=301880 RepID=A0ABQ5B1H1_9ASTR